MAKRQGQREVTRRQFALGSALTAAGMLWGGATLARFAREPSAGKDLGRIGDFDGQALAVQSRPGRPPHHPALPWSAKGGTMNDVSGLSRTLVYGVVAVKNEAQVAEALRFARDHGLKVSLAGVRHSMGGQAFDDGALVLDLRGMNRITLHAEQRSVTVEPGATWHAIQTVLHPRWAVAAMQSTDIFSVGGSVSVNAHGMDHQTGALAGTIRRLKVMLADGTVVFCSREENPDLFRHVVGGYGLFGVVLEADLSLADNPVYRTSRAVIPTADFPRFFARELENRPEVGLFYGHLATTPYGFLEEMIVYRYDRVADHAPADAPPLGEPEGVRLKRIMLNMAKWGGPFQALKWWAEKNLEPRWENCTIPRTQALGEGEACLVSRNDPMHDSVPYLFNDLRKETDILHEYFVPRREFEPFIAGARAILENQDLPVLNASVRVVGREDVALSYAPEPAFSLVLYVNQKADAAGSAAQRKLTRNLIDLTLRHRGRFFLPYQLHYTRAQLLASYPELPEFLAKKREFDPGELFTSTFYRALKAAVPAAA